MQAVRTAIIDKIDGKPSFSGMHDTAICGESTNADNLARLRRVIAAALAWVERE